MEIITKSNLKFIKQAIKEGIGAFIFQIEGGQALQTLRHAMKASRLKKPI